LEEQFIQRISFLRRQGEAVIDLPDDLENIDAIWLIFMAHWKNSYTWDKYFSI